VWENHAPLISSLRDGKISYLANSVVKELIIDGGFVEVNKNIVTVCLELVHEKT